MWYRGTGALGLILLAGLSLPARPTSAQQQQDTTKRGWGIVYSSPRSRATNVNASPAPAAAVAPAPTPAAPATGITPAAPPAAAQPQVTTLPTIRGNRYNTDAPQSSNTAQPTYSPQPYAAPPSNGVYAGDRPAAVSAPTVAAPGTYDTVPPVSNASSGGVRLDELMSLHEYTATGLTSLKPQEVQALEVWLDRYRTAIIDSTNRAAQQRASTSQLTPSAPANAANAANAPAAAATVANIRSVVPANAHSVTGIRSGSRFVQIDDGSVWDIYPADQTETAGWQVGDYVTVRVANQPYGEFDHELVNAQRTGPVRAKFMGYARGQ